MFVVTTMLNHLLEPWTLALLLLVVGCGLQWLPQRRVAGRVVCTAAAAVLVLMAYGVPFDQLARLLEDRYPPLMDPARLGSVRWIIVLGGGHLIDPDLPSDSRPSNSSLYRTVEGLRLQRALPGSRLLFSGGKTFDPATDAEVNSAAAEALGADRANIVLSGTPHTTAEEMACIRSMVGDEPFILVTTALHMPRAMLLAQRFGLHATAAPTDFRARAEQHHGVLLLFPKAGAPLLASAAMHELAGLLWLRIANATGLPPTGTGSIRCAAS
jgi:uncharacterized SAM-binding protein YcdF (DUF218 family)